jgi:hypothetical protein
MNTPNPYGSAQSTDNPDPSQDPGLSQNSNNPIPQEPPMVSNPELTNPISDQAVPTYVAVNDTTSPVQNNSTLNPPVEAQPIQQPTPIQNSNNAQVINPVENSIPQNNLQAINVVGTTNTPVANPDVNNLPPLPTSTTVVDPKKGLPKIIKILIFVVLIIFVLTTLSVVVFGINYLKENHVPLVSGFTETVLLSEGEQFSSRMEYLFDLAMYKALTAENSPFKPDFNPEEIKPLGADKIIEEVENAQQINYETSFSMRYSLAQPLQPVLGIKDPGEISDDSISKILSSREGNINFSSQDSIQFNNQDRARNITNIEFEVPGVNLNTGFETRIIDNLIFFNLDRFPRNDYVKVEEIEGRWLMFDPESLVDDLGLEEGQATTTPTNPLNVFNTFSGMEQEELKKEDYVKIVQLINSSAVQNSITSSYDEKVSETNARCFVMALTQNNIYNIYKQAGRLFDNNYDEDDYQFVLDSDFPFSKSDLTLCFAKLESYPVKVSYEFTLDDESGNLEGVFEFKMTGMEMVTPIEKPTDSTTFTLEDFEELINEDIYATPEPMLYDVDYDFDDDASNNIFDDLDDNSTEGFYTKSNVCEYLSFYWVCDLCTINSPDCQTCLDKYNDLIENGTPMTLEERDTCL